MPLDLINFVEDDMTLLNDFLLAEMLPTSI